MAKALLAVASLRVQVDLAEEDTLLLLTRDQASPPKPQPSHQPFH